MDEWLLKLEVTLPKSEEARRTLKMELWCAEKLSAEDRGYIRKFRPTIRVRLSPDCDLLCFHGSPRSNKRTILSNTLDDGVEKELNRRTATLMAGGHAHIQMLRNFRNTVIINPGSVGLPHRSDLGDRVRCHPRSDYAIVHVEGKTVGIEFRQVQINTDLLFARARKAGMPHVEWWISRWT